MSLITQVAAVTAMNVRSIPQRFGNSCVVVIGIAGVVGVLVSVLGMTHSLSNTLLAAGQPDRAVVLRSGTTSDAFSALTRDAALTIMAAPGIARTAEGEVAASADAVNAVNLRRKSNGTRAGVTVRGVGPRLSAVRPEIRLVEGRMFQPGLLELIVGRGVINEFQGAALGDEVTMRGGKWTVVGVFESADVFESMMLADANTVLSALRRTDVNSVTVKLESAAAFETFRDALTTDPSLSVNVLRETEYFDTQSRGIEGLLGLVTNVVAAIMAVGALFAALNTMYSAVSTRAVEIATLRAIGFGPGSVVVSVFAEALLLAALGAVLGAGVALLLFQGNTMSVGGQNGSTVFRLEVTPALLGLGMVTACAVGLVGALLPAIRAATLPVATALRRT